MIKSIWEVGIWGSCTQFVEVMATKDGLDPGEIVQTPEWRLDKLFGGFHPDMSLWSIVLCLHAYVVLVIHWRHGGSRLLLLHQFGNSLFHPLVSNVRRYQVSFRIQRKQVKLYIQVSESLESHSSYFEAKDYDLDFTSLYKLSHLHLLTKQVALWQINIQRLKPLRRQLW